MYEVVYPLGKSTNVERGVASKLKSLEGMTIAELSNHKFGSALTFEVIERVLGRRFPTLKIIPHSEFGNTYGNAESEVVKA